MKIITKGVLDWDGNVLEEESYEYEGPMALAFWDIAAPIIGSVAGGLLGGSSDTEATTTQTPWAGIQPYMVGTGGGIPEYMSHTPQVSDVWNSWADRLRSGAQNSWMEVPPPMWQGAGGQDTWNPYVGLQPQVPSFPSSSLDAYRDVPGSGMGRRPDENGMYWIPTWGHGDSQVSGYWGDNPQSRTENWYLNQSG